MKDTVWDLKKQDITAMISRFPFMLFAQLMNGYGAVCPTAINYDMLILQIVLHLLDVL